MVIWVRFLPFIIYHHGAFTVLRLPANIRSPGSDPVPSLHDVRLTAVITRGQLNVCWRLVCRAYFAKSAVSTATRAETFRISEHLVCRCVTMQERLTVVGTVIP